MKRKGSLVLDKKDKQILYLLDCNARTPDSHIAAKTRTSKQVVKYRIERLEKEGFIKGYYAMIDTSRLGYTTFRVYLKFRGMSKEKHKQIIEHLKKEKQIWAVVLLAGQWDVALGIAVKDIYGFYEIWEGILEKFLQHIDSYKTSIYSPIYHYSKAYLAEKKDLSPVRILGGQEKTEVDEKDTLLLRALSKNARATLLELASKINLTAEATKRRMKNLEQAGVIQGYRAMIDVEKMGYEFYKAEIRLSNYSGMKAIIEYCHRHPNIYQLDKTIGGETLEVEFHVKSLREMISIIEDMEKQFPGTIEKYDYLTVLSEEKTTYMPE